MISSSLGSVIAAFSGYYFQNEQYAKMLRYFNIILLFTIGIILAFYLCAWPFRD
jgi:Na+-driven multidrug efflux pump